LRTFAELGIHDRFRKAVEEELTKDEKLVWLGRPSATAAVQPPRTVLAVIGAVLLALAFGLGVFGKGVPIFFPGVIGLFGLLFIALPFVAKGGSAYQACYVVTNRRAILLEWGLMGLEPGMSSWTAVRRKSYLPHELLAMERQANPSVPGAGNLIFEYFFTIGRLAPLMPGTQGTIRRTDTPQRTPRGFFYLDNVDEVEQIIRTTLLQNLEQNMDGRPAAARSTERPAPAPAATSGPPAEKQGAVPQGHLEHGPVPADLKAKIVAEVSTNERLVWIGQPEEKLVVRRSLGYLAGGSLVAVLSLLWLVGAFAPKAPAPKKGAPTPQQTTAPVPNRGRDPLPYIVLLASVGCALVPAVRWRNARRTCYALTNRRALIYKEGLLGPTRESYSPKEVAAMRRRDSWVFGEAGDLIFRSVTVVRSSCSQQGGSSRSVRTIHYGFLALARVQEVERLVRETLIDRFADQLLSAGTW
jgi:hypothetical protein